MQSYTVLERGWLSSNSIVFHEGKETAVIDTGYCTHATQTLALINKALNQRPLQRIINTHLHSDHCGGNAALQKHYPDCVTLIPPGLASYIQNWDETALSYLATGQQCPQFQYEALLTPGETIQLGSTTWEIHAAPGHDPDSVILFEPLQRTLISADALWEHGFGVVFPELQHIAAFSEVAATLDLIERLAPRTVIPGHGRVFHDANTALANARGRLERFIAQPESHARYAAKVLIKYKLLELQQCSSTELLDWCKQTSYLCSLHLDFFPQQALHTWLLDVIAQLVRTGAAQINGDQIVNHD